MSETNAKSGKMKGIIGFVLSLVSIVLGGWVISALWAAAGFSTGAGAAGLLLPIGAVVFSAMGMSASKKAGEKRGLAIAGLVIGIIALIYLAIVVAGLGAMSAVGGALLENSDALKDAMEGLENLEDLEDFDY